MNQAADEFYKRLADRARELQERDGLGWGRAFNVARLEDRVRQWPAAWGANLEILVYGDFQKAPDKPVTYKSLRITVHPERQEKTIIRGALLVLKATVEVDEKSVRAVVDAGCRINLLLGVYALHEWGNAGCGWWSWLTHEGGGAVAPKPFDEKLEPLIAAVVGMRADIRKKLESAMFWVRYPRALVLESYRSDILRMFAAYWNAFECLVDAVNLARPKTSLSRIEKQMQIDEFFRQRGGEITAENIQTCFRQIVDPGLRRKAKHAFEVCFGAEAAEKYQAECFTLPNGEALYDIRNAINHGDIDAENPHELIRVDDRMSRLWMIVWRMFGCFIPFLAPLDSDLTKEPDPQQDAKARPA
jgi:hypothetical protein